MAAIKLLWPILLFFLCNMPQNILAIHYDFYRPLLLIEWIFPLFLLIFKKTKTAFFIFFFIACIELLFFIGEVFVGIREFGITGTIQALIDSYRNNILKTLLFFSFITIFFYAIKKTNDHIANNKILPIFIYTAISISVLFYPGDDISSLSKIGVARLIDKDVFIADEEIKNTLEKSVFSKIENIKLKSYSNIGLIIIESWPLYKNEEFNKYIINALIKNKNIKIIENGFMPSAKSTIDAELRHLCKKEFGGYGIKSLPPNTSCFPKELKSSNFKNFSLHAGKSKFYNRNKWYQSVGFDQSYFYGAFKNKKECTANWPGYCDIDLITNYLDFFKSGKNFGYWLTLNSHFPYDSDDIIYQKKEQCNLINLQNKTPCNNLLLVKDYFDSFSINLDKIPEKSIFFITGDHQPYFTNKDDKKLLRENLIPFIIIESIK